MSATPINSEELLDYIVRQIKANHAALAPSENDKYMEGANDALEELAVHFRLVDSYGLLITQTNPAPKG